MLTLFEHVTLATSTNITTRRQNVVQVVGLQTVEDWNV